MTEDQVVEEYARPDSGHIEETAWSVLGWLSFLMLAVCLGIIAFALLYVMVTA
jgi:hypothetical protein